MGGLENSRVGRMGGLKMAGGGGGGLKMAGVGRGGGLENGRRRGR